MAKKSAKKSVKKAPKLGASKPKASSKEQYLGGKLVVRVTKKIINDKEFNNIILEDGTAKILSDKDFAAQATSKRGNLVH